MHPAPLAERVASLEAKEELNATAVQNIALELAALNDKVGRIELKFEKSLSFVGGMAFTFSLIGGAVSAGIMYVFKSIWST